MNLQKTTRYALMALSRMAREPERSFQADLLCEETKIPKRYLRRLMTDLSKAGFIKGSRGRTGGFVFARPISEITLYDIIEKFEEESFQSKCILGFMFCVVDAPCVMHDDWIEARAKTIEVLQNTTLGSLNEKYQAFSV